MLAETVILLVCFAYFLCVTAAYSSDMHGPEEEENKEEPPPAEEDKKSEKSKKSKASSKKSEPKAEGDDAGAGEGGEWEEWNLSVEQVWIKYTPRSGAAMQTFWKLGNLKHEYLFNS